MKNWKINNWLTLLGLFLLLFLTYFRENFLLSINASLAGEKYNRAYTYLFSDFFQSISNQGLISWKWGLTIFFSIIISITTLLAIYSWFLSRKWIKFISVIYIGVFIILLLIGGGAVLFNCFDYVYLLLRRILGIIQSPIPFFIFFTLIYKIDRDKNSF